ncbi:spermidine synthase [Sphingosinicella rhizophila]|uniref:Fused MFS/spermidine synthase n=1 Tax=Sphingosinicella rhizophila TaxID=3050082 RepID=A0ABU3Q3B0_9SPHN|nr:fused MFS/spermidine synthase [Sphingosinicella sp. GR2756]MDT9597903.1 fused MFS/spermidine synthase [Sphingosinicella sp. GR2756]
MTIAQPGSPASGRRELHVKPLFLATILTGSFLLFLTQPMIARMALPRLGGAPAVWNSAMLVYQALLLAGYAYAHFLSRLRPRRQAGLHLAMFALAALWLPIGLGTALPPRDVAPAIWAPWFLLSSIGPLFFIISAQAPLMQRWYALESRRGEPYALYAASNLGSFAGLVSYPLLVEPLLTLEQQAMAWTMGFGLLVLLVAGCAFTMPRESAEEAPPEVSPAPRAKTIIYWMALAAIPSGLMLSTTTHLTTDIVAVPLLWVVPLGLYLLSFVIAFAVRRGAADLVTAIAPVVLLIAGGFAFSDGTSRPLLSAAMGLSLLFVVAIALHAEMYRLRPPPDHLTGFYLAMAAGGVAGGLFCALIAPSLFDWAYEHPLLVIAAAMLVPQTGLLNWVSRISPPLRWALPVLALLASLAADKRIWPGLSETGTILISIGIALLGILYIGHRYLFALCLAALMMGYGGWRITELSFGDARTRSYFGIYTVSDRSDGSARVLTHGTTLHGIQNLVPGEEANPTTYYSPGSGVGLAMRAAENLFGPRAHIGVIGLGTGTLACYALPGQDWRFFEIDPGIERIARSEGRFTFLSRCAPQARVIIGDARLSLAREPPGKLHILAVDAFSSDSVPIHLLTREAFGVYGRAMRPDGLLLVHISNRYLDLRPVVAAAAAAEGWTALLVEHHPSGLADERNASVSVWVALSRNRQTLDALVDASDRTTMWQGLRARRGFAGWSDDYASILPLLKFWPR